MSRNHRHIDIGYPALARTLRTIAKEQAASFTDPIHDLLGVVPPRHDQFRAGFRIDRLNSDHCLAWLH